MPDNRLFDDDGGDFQRSSQHSFTGIYYNRVPHHAVIDNRNPLTNPFAAGS